MACTVKDFKTKKEFKEAVVDYCNTDPTDHNRIGKAVYCYQPGLGPDLTNYTGKICLEGPHFPTAHTWYAEAELINGIVVKVK